MLAIRINTIKNDLQRYPTIGDYKSKSGIDTIYVSDMGNRDYEFLVAIHELVEMYLTQKRGIKEQDITDFDIEFENRRGFGLNETDEAGDSPDAPYQREHRFAENIERQVAHELGANWSEYNNTVDRVFLKK